MYPTKMMDGLGGTSENESDSVLLERRWFAAHKAAQAMRKECEILREVKDIAQANWRDALAKLANLDALCEALAEGYASYVQQSHPTIQSSPVSQMTPKAKLRGIAAA